MSSFHRNPFWVPSLIFYINDLVNTSDKISFLRNSNDIMSIGSDDDILSGKSTDDMRTWEIILTEINTWIEENELLIND